MKVCFPKGKKNENCIIKNNLMKYLFYFNCLILIISELACSSDHDVKVNVIGCYLSGDSLCLIDNTTKEIKCISFGDNANKVNQYLCNLKVRNDSVNLTIKSSIIDTSIVFKTKGKRMFYVGFVYNQFRSNPFVFTDTISEKDFCLND